MTLVERTIARINEEFEKQGNGAVINHKNGKSYNLFVQECGTYRIDDKPNIWEEQTFCKIVPTIEDLARVILSL